jgi:protein gp37
MPTQRPPAPNIWLGVSIENNDYAWRAAQLRNTPAAVRFLSLEPLLGPIDFDLAGMSWVIVGGESGPGHGPMDLEWTRSIRDRCRAAGIAFFFKQVGANHPTDEMIPPDLLIREYPRVTVCPPPEATYSAKTRDRRSLQLTVRIL